MPATPQPPSPFRCGSLALCFFFSVSSVPSVVCFSPCPPCSLWFCFLPLRPAPPSLFGCIPAALRFVFSVSSVSSVLLARRFFSAREDFLCRHTCLVAALPRCGFSFSGLLTPDISPAREDFHAATRARCRRHPNRRPRFVAALSRCVLFSPCPQCPPWFAFLRVLRVLCGLLFCVPSVPAVVFLLRVRLRPCRAVNAAIKGPEPSSAPQAAPRSRGTDGPGICGARKSRPG